FQDLADAYYTLSDTARRAEYDQRHRSAHSDADDVFGDVFEDLLRSEVSPGTAWWSTMGMVSGATMGFIVANLPGAVVGGFAGKKLGAIRDATGRPVYESFKELPHARKLQVLTAIAAHVLGPGFEVSLRPVTSERDPLGLRSKIVSNLDDFHHKTREFYSRQNQFIEQCLSSMNQSDALRQRREAELDAQDLKVRIASYGSLIANIVLFGLQLYTAISSKSLSLFATMADSFMDLLSSGTLVYAGWVTRYRANNSYKYPVGKRRTLGVGIVIFSTLMAGLSIQLLIESIRGLTSPKHNQNVSAANIACIAVALGVKLLMLAYCWSLRQHAEARIFATDHMNDLVLNSFGLAMALLGTHVVWWIDPVGGLLVGLFIMRSWAAEALSQARLLVGTTADTQFLSRLTYMAMVHDSRV
ncbi:hypothetical protein IWW47_005074, partial [Coemansia sp. RSA 2052]